MASPETVRRNDRLQRQRRARNVKSLLKRPRYGLTSPAAWMMLLGAACLFIASSSPIPPFWFSVGTVAVLLATAVWQEQRWAVGLGMLLFGLSAVARLVGLFVMEFRWTRLGFFVVTVVLAYECWEALGGMGKDLDDEGVEEDDDDDDRPMISFVLLQKEAKYLESMILAKMIEAAWGGDYLNQ